MLVRSHGSLEYWKFSVTTFGTHRLPRAIDLAHITLCTRAKAGIINKIVDELLNNQDL